MTPLTADRRLIAAAALALGTAMFVSLNLAASSLFSSARLDLTDNSLFTVSEGTEHILETIEEPITLRFFFSKATSADYPQIQAYAKRVRDLLS